MSQDHLGTLVHLSHATISKMERGKHKIDADLLPGFGVALGVQAGEFFRREEQHEGSAPSSPGRTDSPGGLDEAPAVYTVVAPPMPSIELFIDWAQGLALLPVEDRELFFTQTGQDPRVVRALRLWVAIMEAVRLYDESREAIAG